VILCATESTMMSVPYFLSLCRAVRENWQDLMISGGASSKAMTGMILRYLLPRLLFKNM
jgi:hypothetical protein